MDALMVSRAEAGQKILNFLQRRIDAATGEFHKWIRSGQVRRNGGRVKAFDRVEEGDAIRVPPFALLKQSGQSNTPDGAASPQREKRAPRSSSPASPRSSFRLVTVYEDEDLLILHKPAGLPAQGGTGHAESVVSLLAEKYRDADFMPAPAHRLDRDTSGLLVVGKSYAALRRLSDALALRSSDAPHKEYLAWVWGKWSQRGESELYDLMEKDEAAGRMVCGRGKEARALARPLLHRRIHGHDATLMLVTLLTGRTHQIRVQLSSRGFPLIGDPRYGLRDGEKLKLHAFRLTLEHCGESMEFSCLPDWKEDFDIQDAGLRPTPRRRG